MSPLRCKVGASHFFRGLHAMANFNQSFDGDQIFEMVRRMSEQEAEARRKKKKASEAAVKKLPVVKIEKQHCKKMNGEVELNFSKWLCLFAHLLTFNLCPDMLLHVQLCIILHTINKSKKGASKMERRINFMICRWMMDNLSPVNNGVKFFLKKYFYF